jgi:membrane peptidoglycan carboxypeptidase
MSKDQRPDDISKPPETTPRADDTIHQEKGSEKQPLPPAESSPRSQNTGGDNTKKNIDATGDETIIVNKKQLGKFERIVDADPIEDDNTDKHPSVHLPSLSSPKNNIDRGKNKNGANDEDDGDAHTAKIPRIQKPGEPTNQPGDTGAAGTGKSAEQTERQEKALSYLANKRARHERGISEEETQLLRLESGNSGHNGHNGHNSHSSKDELSNIKTSLLPVMNSQNDLVEFTPNGNGLIPSDGNEDNGRRPSRALALLAAAGNSFIMRRPRTPAQQHKKKVLVRHLVRKHIRQTREDDLRTSKRFWTTLISTTAAVVIVLLSAIGGGAYFAYKFTNDTRAQYQDEVNGLRSMVPLDNLKMYDRNGTMIGQMMEDGLHTSVSYDQIAPDLINATVATEDKDFWTNPGIDLARIIRSALETLQQGKVVAGGSTITQQLIKNLVLKNQKQDITRKFQELVLTPDLNERYSKKDLVEMYVNSNNYSQQAYGIDAAATMYFGLEDKPGKPASSQLTLAQAAMLAGIPNLPSLYDPWQHRDNALNRLEVVLDSMVRNGHYITVAQKEAALAEANKPNFFKHPTNLGNRAPHFYEFVLQELEDQYKVTRAQLARSGMKVYTTVDLNLQDKIQQIAKNQVASLSGSNVTNAAEVMLDYRTGAILTLLGSVDYNDDSINGKFDVATQGYRQMGSSFKPYVYATAMSMGMSPGQAVADVPTTFDPGGINYAPKNYTRENYGAMTIRCALQNSLNVPAVKTMAHAGVENVMNKVRELGFTYEGSEGLSTALGTLEVHLIDHVSAFSAFANGGVHMPYYAVEKVVFTNTGKTVTHSNPQGTRVWSPQVAYEVTDVLSDYTQRYNQFGVCNPLNLNRDGGDCPQGDLIPVAVKTGTTDDFTNVLTVGYTSEFILGVWVGNNDNTPMNGITGIMGSAPIWHDAMLTAMEGREAKGFVNPGGLQKVNMSYSNGVSTNDWTIPGVTTSLPTLVPYTQTGTVKQSSAYCPCYSYGSSKSGNPTW